MIAKKQQGTSKFRLSKATSRTAHMKYQITGWTNNPEFDKCVAILMNAGYPSTKPGRIAIFSTRNEAVTIKDAFCDAMPNVPWSIVEVSDENAAE